MGPIVHGRPAYHAGTSGTLALDPGEKVTWLWCVATAGAGSLTIDGGDAIVLPQGVPFSFGIAAGDPDFVGSSLVFSGTASYFVQTRT